MLTPLYKDAVKTGTNRSVFNDAFARSQQPEELGAKGLVPFQVAQMIAKSVVELSIWHLWKNYLVGHVSHTTKFLEQSRDIGSPIPQRQALNPAA